MNKFDLNFFRVNDTFPTLILINGAVKKNPYQINKLIPVYAFKIFDYTDSAIKSTPMALKTIFII